MSVERHRVARALRSSGLGLVLFLVAGSAYGQVHPAGAPSPTLPLNVVATPSLGDGAPAREGWFAYLVQLHNPTGESLSGDLVLRGQPQMWGGSGAPGDVLMRTTFAVEPGQTAHLELPLHGYRAHGIQVQAVTSDGVKIGEADGQHAASGDALLFDLTVPSRIAKELTAKTLVRPAPGYMSAPGSGSATMQTISVTSPRVDAKTGAALAPTHAAAYSTATLVLAESEDLEALSEAQLIALSGWVLSGGSLAVSVTRPEDLRGNVLPRFAGDVLREGPLGSAASITLTSYVPDEGAPTGSGSFQVESATARDVTWGALVGYRGGNLQETRFGASATYGLGEVHLLAFKPNREPFLGDPWVQFQLMTLMERAMSVRTHVASPFALQAPGDWRAQQVRRSLDPNVGNHWVNIVSAILLLLYAIVAGPINFQKAAKSGQPLRALVRLPLISLIAFLAILTLGWVSKGARSRARHLTLVEAGGGMSRASAVRFRAFYGPSADELRVRSTERGNVLATVQQDSAGLHENHMDRDGFRLDDFSAGPWETVVVREDGFLNLAGGVALAARGDDVVVHNRTGKPLAGVVVTRPDGRMFFHARIEDHAQVLASDGASLFTNTPGSGSTALDLGVFRGDMEQVVPGLGAAFETWETMNSEAEWWPSNTPVLLAQWVGGEGKLEDSGYEIDNDRVLLRVVGFGGRP